MPVREALRMLQQAGLVIFENHRGATVAELSFDELYEVIETRTHLEVLAMCLAVPFHDQDSLGELDALHAEMSIEGSGAKYFSLNHAFHLALYRPCKNRFLKNEIDGLWDRAWRRWTKSLFEARPTRIALANAEHLIILDAVRRKAVDDVERAARLHRENTLLAWRSLVAGEDETQRAYG
jgi:DNA-binding GntR family transcriptional regulator